MKLTLLLMVISFSGVYALDGYSQTTKLTLKVNSVSLEEVFSEIEELSEFRFFYSRKIDIDKTVSFDIKNKKITEILDEIKQDVNFNYEVVGIQIILLPPNEKYFSNQQLTIEGKVSDTEGNPLPGVNVVEKGTTNGAITNPDGEYTISVGSTDAILSFSYIGFLTEEIKVNGQTSIDMILVEDITSLEEVVVIGYGTQRRQAVTGAVAVADLETFREVPVNNVLEMVKGTIPGLVVGATNTAGAEAGLKIRGENSPNTSNTPLLVVDGVIYHGSLNDIANEDIESFTVLKDASAAAVYGSRSANGVILIETKRGRGINGKARFNVKLSYGITNELRPLELYDADGYIQRLMDIYALNGIEVSQNDVAIYMTEYERENYNATPDHKPTLKDPYELIRQIGYNRKANIGVSNSTDKSNYYISVSGTDQKGVTLNDKYKNLSGRINIRNNLAEWFDVGVNAFYSFRDYSGDSPNLKYATLFSPWAKVYNDDGTYNKFPNTTTSAVSPFWDIASVNVDKHHQLNGIADAVIKAPWVKGLSYNLKLSKSTRWHEGASFYDLNTISGEASNGKGGRSYSRTNNFLVDNIIQYNRVFADKHDLGVTLLHSMEQENWESMSASAQQFENTVLQDYKLENGSTQTVDTGGGESAGIGMMARATYTYDKKYSLTATIRRDGFSGFSKNKKWGNFSSLGFNWNISRESFMENVNAFDNLAFRVSYGTNGNLSIDPYSTLAKVGTSKYVLGGYDGYSITQYISSLPLNNLGWESTTGTNIGIDFSVLDKRISGSVDGYLTSTRNLLFSRSIPGISGHSSIMDNIGEIQNKGVEIELHTINIQKNNFRWSSDFAFSLNRNKVVTILGEDNDGDGVEDDIYGVYIGRTLGALYTAKIIGMYQQEDVDNGTIMTGMRPGDYIIEDISGPDGVPDGKITGDDRQFIGNKDPNFRWSWTNTLKYKNFTLMAYLYSIWGGNGYFLGTINPYNDTYVMRPDINHPVYDYWTPDNTDAEFPRLDYRARAAYRATKWYNRSFIKLQKVSLSYNMDKLVKPMGVNNMLLSVSADNLFLWAPHWPGLDADSAQGLQWNSVPSMRTYLFTLSFNF